MTIKVGDMLWTHPYGRPERVGQESGYITGETTQSWLIGDPKHKREKVSKKELRENIPNFGYRQWYTGPGKDDYQFLRAYRHQISAAVLTEKDTVKLKHIAEILGMEIT